ncbi:PAS domain S-box protein [Hansschlegelia sp. KR7-227]|uniref:hybrid sensor histidine kinase/response regulator n=1 Tax=Hansschlegelia sp. KR7-227 TaxID=3400914 RepID=UPI003C03D564
MDLAKARSPETDERYRLLVENIVDYAIYMLDPDGVITSWNAGARRSKGYSAEEILGRNFSQFYTEEDRAAGLPQIVLATAGREGRFEGEGWRVRKDGARFWAHVVVDAIRDDAGSVIGFAKITRDLTERRKSEDALRRSEDQFRLLVQSVTDYAIYMLDLEGRVSSWNLGAQRIKGYLPQEIIGEHFSKFYTEEDRAAGLPQTGLRTALETGRFEKEGWRLRKDGSRFWANVVIDPVRDDQGELRGFAKITRDITERREGQLALEQAREAYFQAQKMEAVGQLTGGVAHDFNNLLMAIMGSLDLLRKRLPHEPRVDRLLDNARQAAQRGASLTQRMLAFSRRQELKTEPVDAAWLVKGMGDLLRHTLGGAIKVETCFPPVLRPILADPNQLELAILNLAVNARDAMPAGGTISITGREERLGPSTSRRLVPGLYLCLSIRDTGEGMDEATMARAVEPFFTTKGVGKGTGLGLSMVAGTVEQLGGELILKSAKGTGTTVELWLPESAEELQEPRPLSADLAPSHDGARMTVLLVDDDPLVLVSSAEMLEDLGHRVLTTNSGAAALAVLGGECRIDLLITDQAMPEMTGLQLAERTRMMKPELPVIIASGFAELPKIAEAQILKLAKPFTQQALAEAILEARTFG